MIAYINCKRNREKKNKIEKEKKALLPVIRTAKYKMSTVFQGMLLICLLPSRCAKTDVKLD